MYDLKGLEVVLFIALLPKGHRPRIALAQRSPTRKFCKNTVMWHCNCNEMCNSFVLLPLFLGIVFRTVCG